MLADGLALQDRSADSITAWIARSEAVAARRIALGAPSAEDELPPSLARDAGAVAELLDAALRSGAKADLDVGWYLFDAHLELRTHGIADPDERLRHSRAACRALGFDDRLTAFHRLRDPDALAAERDAWTLLAATAEEYRSLHERLLGPLEHGVQHTPRSFAALRARSYPPLEPPGDGFVAERYFADLGLPPAPGVHVVRSLGADAFCVPAIVPSEIYVVVPAGTDAESQRVALHELSHGQRFARISPQASVPAKFLGNFVSSEAFAFLFDGLFEDEAFVARYLTPNHPQAIVRASRFLFLYLMRSECINVVLEHAAHGSGSGATFAALAQLAAELTREHLLLRTGGARAYRACAGRFLAAEYLRAWRYAGTMRRRFRVLHGPQWWSSGEMAATLHSLWKEGSARYAAELLADFALGDCAADVLLGDA